MKQPKISSTSLHPVRHKSLTIYREVPKPPAYFSAYFQKYADVISSISINVGVSSKQSFRVKCESLFCNFLFNIAHIYGKSTHRGIVHKHSASHFWINLQTDFFVRFLIV